MITATESSPNVSAVRYWESGRPVMRRTMWSSPGPMSAVRSTYTSGPIVTRNPARLDRLRVVVFPVINGATGREHFYTGWPDVVLETVDHRTFDGRLQMMEYVPTVLDGPPA